MTTYTLDPSTDYAALAAENARLRNAVAHLSVYARAVLECRDNGSITIASQGPIAYQASAALGYLDECVARAVGGDWQPVTREQIAAIWERHAKHPLWGEDYMTRDRWAAAVNTLLWHPERQGLPPHPPHRQCGCQDCAPSFEEPHHV